MGDLNHLERGLVAGLLIGEGHFGVDRGRAQVVAKMHVRHEPLLRRLARPFFRTELHTPYAAGARRWMQWMARGPGLACELLPAVEPVLRTGVDPHVLHRLEAMTRHAAPYLAEVLRREQGVATYRVPRTGLTVG
jgi:hypothetical protein